jgi:Domain of unknown function (DUF397)
MDLTRATWRTSSYSGNNGGNCVEVAAARKIAIRDSKDPHGPVLAFAPKDRQRFADRIKAGA